jgi:plasmid maintenance system killer protein
MAAKAINGLHGRVIPCRAAMELDWVAEVSSPGSWRTAWPRGCPLIVCIVYWYATQILKSYRHKGVKQFAETGSKAGIRPAHANRLRRLLSALAAATCRANMNAPGYALHPLKGDRPGGALGRAGERLTFARARTRFSSITRITTRS